MRIIYICLLCLFASFKLNAAPSAVVTFKAEYIRPTCSLVVPPVVDLGRFTIGERRDKDFTVTINCSDTSGISEIMTTTTNRVAGEKLYPTNVNNRTHEVGSLMISSPKASGVDMAYFNDDTRDGLCRATQGSLTRTCDLTVHTSINTTAHPGEFSASVVMEARYN